MNDLKLASGGIGRLTALLMLLLFTACQHEQQLPIDDMATKETINLYNNLKKIPRHGFMVGHLDDLAYGVEWKYEEGRSDGYKPVEDHVEYYMPYPGHPSADDFIEFYNHPKTLFENEVAAMNLYE